MLRRNFLAKIAALGATLGGGAWTWQSAQKNTPKAITGKLTGPNIRAGHALRDRKSIPEPTDWQEIDTLIIGGGISGLIAARELHRKGKKFLLVELEDTLGGNAIGSSNAISPYPLGAHYVPIINQENTEILRFFEEIGVIIGYNEDAAPIYKEEYLCFAPHERLHLLGRWQEGLIPQKNIPTQDTEQITAFLAEMHRLKTARGNDGKPLFCIPASDSSQDAAWLALDGLSFRDWLLQRGWTSEYLHWYANYCTRDDYGAPHSEVSAWAGIHYFASRRGTAANAPEGSVLTWAEGNHWLVKRIAEQLPPASLQTGIAVHQLRPTPNGIEAHALRVSSQTAIGIRARHVIVAIPHFVAKHLLPFSPNAFAPTHYPWLVANITLSEPPNTGVGVPLAWDNVAYNRPSLGYVVATHQQLIASPNMPTVLAYYQPLCDTPATEARTQAFSRSYADYQAIVLTELTWLHPDIVASIQHIDCHLWGHGMVCPVPNFLWGTAKPQPISPNIHLAHTDYSGISLFEEAFYQGIRAAAKIS